MIRSTLILAGLAGMFLAGAANAQNPIIPPQGPFAVPLVGGAAPTISAEDTSNRYGWNPVLRRLFHLRGPAVCNTGANACGPNCGPVVGPSLYPQGGTLAFPNHPYARSPRDFFMIEK